MENDNNWQQDHQNNDWDSQPQSNAWDTSNAWDKSNTWDISNNEYDSNHNEVHQTNWFPESEPTQNSFSQLEEEQSSFFSKDDDDQSRYDPSKSRLLNINNLNGLKSGLHTMDESTPMSNNSSSRKSSLSAKNAELMSFFRGTSPNNSPANSSRPDEGLGNASNSNSSRNSVEKDLESLFTSENDENNTSNTDSNLFKSYTPVEPKVKVIKHPFLKAKKRFMQFVKISALSLGGLIAVHNLTTPSIDTKGLSEQQIAAANAEELKLSAGIGNIELVAYKALRLYDNNVPTFFDSLLGRKYNPFDFTLLSPSTKRAVDQASLNKMLKDFPAYPEANKNFLVEDHANREVRVNIMTNLINKNHFAKHGSIMHSHLEDEMFVDAIRKNMGMAINQTTSYPFKHADAGLVGTKAPSDGGRNFTATGKISETVPESASFVKGFVELGDIVTVPVVTTYRYLTSPTIKFAGMFSSDDSLKNYTKDSQVTSVKGYLVATNTFKDNPIQKTDYQYLSADDNKKMQELQEANQYEPDGGKSFDEILAMSAKMQKDYLAQNNLLPANKQKASNEDSKFKINKEAILNNVKTVTQPDPATIESSKTKGLEMIKDVQRPKP